MRLSPIDPANPWEHVPDDRTPEERAEDEEAALTRRIDAREERILNENEI